MAFDKLIRDVKKIEMNIGKKYKTDEISGTSNIKNRFCTKLYIKNTSCVSSLVFFLEKSIDDSVITNVKVFTRL